MRTFALSLKSQVLFFAVVILFTLTAGCSTDQPPIQETLVEKGQRLFFTETFGGNGRTCSTCHRAEAHMGLDPAFIATLPATDPLFVAETNPELAELEDSELLRKFALICENLDGFAKPCVLRGVPHTLGLPSTVASAHGPRLGWSGDGAPRGGTLRDFAIGAVVQHFPKSLARIEGQDFRLPTDDELDALEAFQLSLGRQRDLVLPLTLRNPAAHRGQELFQSSTKGKCFFCHANAGANAIVGPNLGNANFNTGVENLPNLPRSRVGRPITRDDGFGAPGDGTFNTPSLVESAKTPPLFHNNAVNTIEEAVAFYVDPAFISSPSGQALRSATGGDIALAPKEVAEVAIFLRVITAIDSIDESIRMLAELRANHTPRYADFLRARIIANMSAAISVLGDVNIHRDARSHLANAQRLMDSNDTGDAESELRLARERITGP